ncbi:DUF1996 domain-containing protein [Actinomycetospora aeridis]|uniref:DUF1996 domain-containing protein n=1 Tax=Actinomycetospora aeridis TaxID=3129231 RepID=A0ABU8N187_9PSEU
MPRRGRHRSSLPARLIAAVAALLVTLGVVVVAGSAAADDSGGGGVLSALTGGEDSGSDADDSGDDGSGGDDADGSGDADGSDDADGSGGTDETGDGDAQDEADGGSDAPSDEQREQDGQQDGQDGRDDRRSDRMDRERPAEDVGEVRGDGGGAAAEAAAAADPFPGRDQIAPAGEDDYVAIADVEPSGNIGDGGQFRGGSYTVDCGVSDHNNSDNYMAAPGKRNGAQHVHDYVGNRTTDADSDETSLQEGATSCGNGDQSTFFWPVLRDLNGTGPDVGRDGGSLDGNVGSILTPRSAQLTFRGHGDRPVQAMPAHLMIIMGNAKAGAQDQKNANAKYTCTGQEQRVTDRYPICGPGSRLVRMLDYPSCWDGENLETEDLRSHMSYPDERGNCERDEVPVPALRITLTYDQPEGRAFSIDSFPNEQHSPTTDHSDYENIATEEQSRRGAECINENLRCADITRDGTGG